MSYTTDPLGQYWQLALLWLINIWKFKDTGLFYFFLASLNLDTHQEFFSQESRTDTGMYENTVTLDNEEPRNATLESGIKLFVCKRSRSRSLLGKEGIR